MSRTLAAHIEGLSATGLDPDEDALALGRERVHDEGLDGQVALMAGDAQALPFPNEQFDELLERTRHRHAYLEEDPMRAIGMGEVISKPLMIIKGRVPADSDRGAP